MQHLRPTGWVCVLTRCECWLGHRYPGFYLCYYLNTNINTKILLSPGLGQAQARPTTSLSTTAHTLEQVQKLHGQLSHTSLVIPEGSAYLTLLQSMLGIFGNNPFMPCRQPRSMVSELHWWLQALDSKPPIPIPFHPLTLNLCAFSDASTSHSLVIVIGDR